MGRPQSTPRITQTATLAFLLVAALLPLWQRHLEAQSPAPANHAGGSDLSVAPERWAETAVLNEEHIVDFDRNVPLQYKMRRVDAKGEVMRQVIESRDGTVARLLEKNGLALTRDEDQAERERLQAILDDPDAFLRHVHHEDGSRSYATELLRAMPKAMIWSYTPGQPQLPGYAGTSVVLDFRPDPQFHPPSLVTEGLTGIAGRVWVDVATHCVERIQGNILRPVNFGWGGVLARIREGGTVELEQRRAANHRWIYSHLVEHLTIREVLVHTVAENAETMTAEVQPLPASISVKEAVQRLLTLAVPTR